MNEPRLISGLMIATSQRNNEVETYFDNGQIVKATTELFETNAGEVDSVELPVTLLIMHSAGSAVNISVCN